MALHDTAMWPRNPVHTGHWSTGDLHLKAYLSQPWRTESDISKESCVWAIMSTTTGNQTVWGECVHRNNTTTHTMYVVSRLKTNLLGLPAITTLQPCYQSWCHHGNPILHPNVPVCVPRTQKPRRRAHKSKLSQEEWSMPSSPHGNIPLPLWPKGKQELDRMESIWVIYKVDEPTEWCTGMVAVPKKWINSSLYGAQSAQRNFGFEWYALYQNWTKHLRSCQEPRFSVNWMSVVDFCTFPWQNNPDCWLRSWPLWVRLLH